ncbi:MAG: PRC-barrel domain-containing protein [Bradyrhizobium sp.]
MRKECFVAALAVTLAISTGAWAQGETAGRSTAQDVPKRDAAKEPQPPPSVTVIGARDAHGILGREVRSAVDENMGRIVDVIVDREGQVRAAVIDFGGFLGVGSRKIVVDWRALRFGAVENKKDSITLELTREQVSKAPEYKEDQPVIVLGAAGSLQPWQFDH